MWQCGLDGSLINEQRRKYRCKPRRCFYFSESRKVKSDLDSEVFPSPANVCFMFLEMDIKAK